MMMVLWLLGRLLLEVAVEGGGFLCVVIVMWLLWWFVHARFK